MFDYIPLYSINHTLLTNNKHKLLFTRKLTRQEMKEKNMLKEEVTER